MRLVLVVNCTVESFFVWDFCMLCSCSNWVEIYNSVIFTNLTIFKNWIPLHMTKYCRLEICRDRRSCKIFVSCVIFFRKQRNFLYIIYFASLHTPKCKLPSQLLKNLHILFTLNQKRAKLLMMMHFFAVYWWRK